MPTSGHFEDYFTGLDEDATPANDDLVMTYDTSGTALKTVQLSNLPGGTVDASVITYTPTVLTDWDADADPGDVDNALDQLAERVDDLEGAGGGGDLVKIEQVVVGAGGTATITFDSIPSTYENLEIELMCRSAYAAVFDFGNINVNDDTGNNYDYYFIKANTTTVAVQSAFATGGVFIGSYPGANAAAGAAGSSRITIPGYARTVFHKIFKLFTANAGTSTANSWAGTGTGRWRSTNAITKVVLTSVQGNFVEGSVATLYGRE
jgi:hypothetical protein